MKWTKIFFGGFVLGLILLIGGGLAIFTGKITVPADWCLFAIITFIVFLFVAGFAGKREIAAAVRNAYVDFLENDAPLPPADRLAFSAEYLKDIDDATRSLLAVGMKFEMDCRAPDEELSGLSSGKVLARILSNEDKTVWCIIKKLSISNWAKLIPGISANLNAILEFYVFFENGPTLIVTNMSLPSLPKWPEVIFQITPSLSPEQVLQKCLSRKHDFEHKDKTPSAHPLQLDLKNFLRLYQAVCLYINHQSSGSGRIPSDRVMLREGFSPSAIEKHRLICKSPLYLLTPAVLKNAVRENKNIRIEVIPPSVADSTTNKKKSRRKGCLVGCGVLTLLLVGCLGYMAYCVYLNVAPILSAVNSTQDIEETQQQVMELGEAFTRLDKALQAHAPALAGKRRPLSLSAQQRLHQELQENDPIVVSLWFLFLSGLEGHELIPGCEVTGIEEALDIRKQNGMAVVRLAAPYRAESLLLLHDGAGDGYFYRFTGSRNYVYYDMLEDGMDDPPLGSLAQFVNAISDAIEEKLWTYDADGKLIEGKDTWTRFQEILLKNTMEKK